MRAGHSSLKVSLSRFNIVSTAECECDELQTKEHIFCDCKLCGKEETTMMDILSEGEKKRIPRVSYRALKARRKAFVEEVCYVINKIPKFI
jgi:hypothetical protein